MKAQLEANRDLSIKISGTLAIEPCRGTTFDKCVIPGRSPWGCHTQADELRMSEMLVGGPLEELELGDGIEAGFSPTHSGTFALLTRCAYRPLIVSGRFANGQSLISSP